jgi:hypothetical protein
MNVDITEQIYECRVDYLHKYSYSMDLSLHLGVVLEYLYCE